MRVPFSHVPAVAGLAVLAIVWTWPLAQHAATHIPGAGSGDNISFLWNFWWMRTAAAEGRGFFSTPYLFAPAGVDLTLHTHAALLAFVGSTALGGLTTATALNATILGSIALSGISAYALAFRVTRDRTAAFVAGTVFSGSPFIAAHLTGHFNLVAAWPVPLFALTFREAVIQRSTRWAIAAGITAGATMYVDYYYVVFLGVLALCVMSTEALAWTGARAEPRRHHRIVLRAAIVLLVVDAAIVLAIAVTGGFTIESPVRVRLQTAFNPLQIFWTLAAIACWAIVRPRVSAAFRPPHSLARTLRTSAIVAAACAVVALPMLVHAASLVARGEYVSQRYLWRSAPKGVDVATLALGHPFSAQWGEATRGAYRAMGIDAVESSAWLGIFPTVLAIAAIRRRWPEPGVRQWSAVGAVFFVWALGPHLMAFGVNTGMILPQALLRSVPIVANARMPGRAMVVVSLAVAMLCAHAIAARTPRRTARQSFGLLLIAALIVVELAPAPLPLLALDHPVAYDLVRSRPEPGAVCELPLGLRDGFGERGHFDERTLLFQTIHGRPIAGGFVARLPPSVLRVYEADPLLSTLLRLSGDTSLPQRALPDPATSAAALRQLGIDFVVVNRLTATPALVQFVATLPLEKIAADDERDVYVVRR